MSPTPHLSSLYRERACGVCGEELTFKREHPGPYYCPKHEGGKTMPRKKKDFSEAVAASQEPAKEPGHSGPNGTALTAPGHERIERKRYKERLPVPIAPEIVALRGDELAKAWREIEELKVRQREHNAEFREQRSHLDKKAGELATSVEQHTEVREVDVVEYLIAGTGTLEVVRLDTMEVFSTKAAGADDLQETIFGKTAKTVKAVTDAQLFGDDDEDDAAGDPDDDKPEGWTEGANPKPVEASQP